MNKWMIGVGSLLEGFFIVEGGGFIGLHIK